jgi:hypothetical protein
MTDKWAEFERLWLTDEDEGGFCIVGTPSRAYKPLVKYLKANFISKDELREKIEGLYPYEEINQFEGTDYTEIVQQVKQDILFILGGKDD